MPVINEEKPEIVKVDKKDLDILAILVKNSRETCKQIAKKVGLSNDAVGYRIERLVKLGVIDGFTLDLDYNALDINEYEILFQILEQDPKELVEFYKCIQKYSKQILVYSDKWDMKVTLVADSTEVLDQIITDISNKFSDIIIDYEIMRVVRKIRGQKSLLVELDATDQKILEMLSKNSRETIASIATKLKLNADTVIYRMKKELAKVIHAFTTKINYSKLGEHMYTLVLIMKVFGAEEEARIQDFIDENTNVSGAIKTIGHWNVVLNVFAKDQTEFQEILTKLKVILGSSLKDYDVLMAYKEI